MQPILTNSRAIVLPYRITVAVSNPLLRVLLLLLSNHQRVHVFDQQPLDDAYPGCFTAFSYYSLHAPPNTFPPAFPLAAAPVVTAACKRTDRCGPQKFHIPAHSLQKQMQPVQWRWGGVGCSGFKLSGNVHKPCSSFLP